MASQSFAALLVFNALAPVYAAHPELARALVSDRERSLAGYFLTVELLRARDGAAARAVVREALEHVDAAALEALRPRKKRRASTRGELTGRTHRRPSTPLGQNGHAAARRKGKR